MMVLGRDARICIRGYIFCGYPQFSRIRIVTSLLERIWILCHGYSTDMHYALMLFCLHLILCIVYIRRHIGHRHKMQLQVIELSSTEYRVIDALLRQIRVDQNTGATRFSCP